jgi:hypothetical protein
MYDNIIGHQMNAFGRIKQCFQGNIFAGECFAINIPIHPFPGF